MPSSARIHYVIGAYVGSRLHVDGKTKADPWRYLREHLGSLWRLEHSLAQITVMLNTDAPVDIPSWLPDGVVRGSAFSIIERPNVGLSYGGFSEAFDRGGDFTHWLFTEDDYVFTQDRFDEILLAEWQSTGSHLLTGAAYRVVNDPFRHGAVQPHFASTEVWNAAAEKRDGHLPYSPSGDIRSAGMFGQKDLAFACGEAGHEATDWLLDWSTAYRSGEGEKVMVRWFSRRGNVEGDPQGILGDLMVPALIVPVQAFDRESMLSDGQRWWRGMVQRDGSVGCLREAGVPGSWAG